MRCEIYESDGGVVVTMTVSLRAEHFAALRERFADEKRDGMHIAEWTVEDELPVLVGAALIERAERAIGGAV